jgi:hypothetical protein
VAALAEIILIGVDNQRTPPKRFRREISEVVGTTKRVCWGGGGNVAEIAAVALVVAVAVASFASVTVARC